MLQVNLEEAKDRLLELINAVLKGETVLIIKDLQEAVQLVSAVSVTRRQFGSAKGLIVMADNFDALLPDFVYAMKLLLDTHALLWFIGGNERLSSSARALIEEMNNDVYLSRNRPMCLSLLFTIAIPLIVYWWYRLKLSKCPW